MRTRFCRGAPHRQRNLRWLSVLGRRFTHIWRIGLAVPPVVGTLAGSSEFSALRTIGQQRNVSWDRFQVGLLVAKSSLCCRTQPSRQRRGSPPRMKRPPLCYQAALFARIQFSLTATYHFEVHMKFRLVRLNCMLVGCLLLLCSQLVAQGVAVAGDPCKPTSARTQEMGAGSWPTIP